MNLNPKAETLAQWESDLWLGSKDGLGTPKSIVIDGAALGAIYTAGLAKSGTLLAKHTGTGRYVPYDSATSANGLDVPAGFLYRSIDIRDGAGGFVNSPAAILLRGFIRTTKLPRSTGQTGGLASAAKTALSNR